MAQIVLAMGTSHGPMLVTPPDLWQLRVLDDVRDMHPWRGRQWSYQELCDARRAEELERQITPEELAARHARCQRAIERMADIFSAAQVDLAVIVGNDQMEIYSEDLIPAFGVLWGETIANTPYSAERLARLPPGIAESIPGYIPPGGAHYRGATGLARHLIAQLMASGFDVAAMKGFPKQETPHAYGFVYRRIMRDQPVPSVPVVLNTFYPPNQPNLRRCHDFGLALGDAIARWPVDARVALIASGGLSHFVIDEDLDRLVLESLVNADIDPLERLGEAVFQSGSSEIKNWLPVSAALRGRGLKREIIDFVPLYRTAAGTGNAMAFVCWQP
jgi:Catalytic LigB subunit of aromatic ring-opening dioxygenase